MHLRRSDIFGSSNRRIEYLDIARTFAIFCVVLCHSVETIYKFSLQEWNGYTYYCY